MLPGTCKSRNDSIAEAKPTTHLHKHCTILITHADYVGRRG